MLQIGIIGAGRIGKVHSESITYHVKDAVVAAIADPFMSDETKAWAENLGIPSISKDYRIQEQDAVVSVCTDLGHFSEQTFEAIKSSALVFLECNYDPKMLISYPRYPVILKNRINGKNGHLSNLDCAKAIEKLVNTGTRLVVLSHISEHTNTVEIAVQTVANYLTSKNIIPNVNVRLDIAHHEQRGTIFRLNPTKK